MARFARESVERRTPVARGECWDLAHEALVSTRRATGQVNLAAPFVSIGRTHGHLIFHATAPRDGEWYGRDLYVRAGDIVEWRSVTIREVGMSLNSYSILGDPDVSFFFSFFLFFPPLFSNERNETDNIVAHQHIQHTAVIVATGQPLRLPEPSSASAATTSCRYSPESIGLITVVEQSLGQVPTERTYDLATLSKGEIRIYRPCAIRDLVGIDKIEPKWPDDDGDDEGEKIQCRRVEEIE